MPALGVRGGGRTSGATAIVLTLSTLFLSSSLLGCFSPAYEAPRCSPLGECPSGFTCVGGEVCVRNPMAEPDGGADPMDAPVTPPVDAPLIDAPPVSTVPSCAPSRPTCGPAGNDDCCASPLVPAGTFGRGYDLSGEAAYPSPGSAATFPAFRLDRYEITVGRYRRFVAAMKGTQADPPVAGTGAHPTVAGTGWQAAWNTNLPANQAAHLTAFTSCPQPVTWTPMPGANENLPVNCINWYQAMAFCIWDGGFLPTESEWHYVGSGGSEQRAFPWSVPASSLTVNDTYASYNCNGDGNTGNCALADILAVGSRPAGNGRWGHADLGGNLVEWTMDGPFAYPTPCANNCVALQTGTAIIRGGSFDRQASDLRPSYRLATGATTRIHYIGARCARPAN